jgi:hypothetical protein
MEAVRTSKASVYFNEVTRWYIIGGCNLHICGRETLKISDLIIFNNCFDSSVVSIRFYFLIQFYN